MRKLTLREVRVDSFVTDETEAARGTVRARATEPDGEAEPAADSEAGSRPIATCSPTACLTWMEPLPCCDW